MLISFFSLMVAITSLITHSGVEAPAAIPILLHFAISCNGKSSFFSTKNVFLHIFFDISYNFCVLELSMPPIISMASHFAAKSAQLFCLSEVALQMVFFTSTSVFSRSKTARTSSKTSFFIVVCAIMKYAFFSFTFLLRKKSSASAAEFKIAALFSHQPLIPITSG